MPNINDAFPSAYLRADDLRGQRIAVQISKVMFEKLGDDPRAVLYFAGKDKGLVLNKTNARRITELLQSAITEEWSGQWIVLYPTTTDFKGETVACIRVDKAPESVQAPAPEPEPKPSKFGLKSALEGVMADEIPF